MYIGRAVAQAVSRWLLTEETRVRVWSIGICGGQVALERVFSEYFGFPCKSSFHQILHHHKYPAQACNRLLIFSNILRLNHAYLHFYETIVFYKTQNMYLREMRKSSRVILRYKAYSKQQMMQCGVMS
jgi:hypothetical protein